ncbi:hypothetical protein [Candidatus Phycosocius spiralis]|uniref:Uncharacterized protein n=1 Tax=Candidatus Phycosocius spiralis TaxID=2815099 RepID=A0ABQ4PSL3_9PROT|nr:hypothetical protein [Candidatus Phycosocius spiralis]GIU65985.1 hypothetical protein PsB1_0139 [Candidatus Phycosocius spiralis]
MPTLKKNYDSIAAQDEDLIPLNAILEVESSEIEDYYPRLDAFYDHLDAQWSSFSSFDDYAAMVEQAVATEDAYFQGFLAARFANKIGQRVEHVIVRGVRRRAPSSGGSLGPYFTGGGRGGGGGGGVFSRLLTDTQKANLRANLKMLFPGITDAEIDVLVAQLDANPLLLAYAWPLRREIPILNDKGRVYVLLSKEQLNAANAILNGLRTPEAAAAKQRLDQAIKNGSIRIKRPPGRYGF